MQIYFIGNYSEYAKRNMTSEQSILVFTIFNIKYVFLPVMYFNTLYEDIFTRTMIIRILT